MSSSGGDWYKEPRGRLAARAAQVTANATDASVTATHNAAVNELLADELKACNGRDAGAAATHMENLRDAISKLVEDGQLQLLFGGSVRKYTFVNGLSDVDLLVVLNDTSLADKSPDEVLAAFAERIRQRLGDRTPVKVGALAITVTYADGIEIQLLPALRTATGLRIKDPSTGDWSNVVRPQKFAQKLTAVNQDCGGNVVPVIKLYKSLQSNFVKSNQLGGYHVESLAIEAFKEYGGPRSLKAMLLHFCDSVASRVLRPIEDRTGQSLHLDDKLGAANSVERVRIAQHVADVAARLRAADVAGDAEVWRRFFDGE